MSGDARVNLTKWLKVRDLSVAEARAKLAGAELPEAEIDAAMGWALDHRYLDDARLARNLIRKELDRKPLPGRDLVRSRVVQRGVAEETCDRILNEAFAAVDPNRELREYVRLMAGRVKERTLFGRLVRAGYAPEEIAEAFGACGLEAGEDSQEPGSYED